MGATLGSLVNFSIICGSLNILISRSISIKLPCSVLYIRAATTTEAVAKSHSKPRDTGVMILSGVAALI